MKTKQRRRRRGLLPALVALATTLIVVATAGIARAALPVSPMNGELLNYSNNCLAAGTSLVAGYGFEALEPCNGQPSAEWRAVPLSGGDYKLVDGNNNCLTTTLFIAGYAPCQSGQASQEWRPANVNPPSTFHSYQLISAASGECLGISSGATTAGSQAVVATCNATASDQRWNGIWFFGIINDDAIPSCLDLAGTYVIGDALCADTWELDGLTGHLQDSASGVCVDLQSLNSGAGGLVVQATCSSSLGQAWYWEPFTARLGHFVNGHSGLCLAEVQAGQPLQQLPCTSALPSGQLWGVQWSTRGQ
jgi:hypothetical protein